MMGAGGKSGEYEEITARRARAEGSKKIEHVDSSI